VSRYFGEVEIVHLTPTSMVEDQKSKVKYEVGHLARAGSSVTLLSLQVFYFHGEWSSRNGTAGGCGQLGGCNE
jgi:hypothetical protein